jgi:Histidyl-tRNA synthetase
MSKTNPARGMRDFLPADVRKREYVIEIIKRVYESFGFEPLETPAVENIETLMGKYGEEGNQLVFKILKRGEKLREGLESGVSSLDRESSTQDSRLKTPDSRLSDLALRYDLTVPLARVVADRRNELPKFFKRYQIQPVWRADRPARGRFREFYQCDVDAIGSKSVVVEAELISAVSTILKRLGFHDFKVRINHREILTDILDTAGVASDKHADALVAIDKLDKIGTEGVRKELADRGIDEKAAAMLTTFLIKLTPSSTRAKM